MAVPSASINPTGSAPTPPSDSSPPDRTPPDRLLTPGEVAAMFRVDPKTVARWAGSGKLTSLRTLGGHRRYKASEVASLLAGGLTERETDATPLASGDAT